MRDDWRAAHAQSVPIVESRTRWSAVGRGGGGGAEQGFETAFGRNDCIIINQKMCQSVRLDVSGLTICSCGLHRRIGAGVVRRG